MSVSACLSLWVMQMWIRTRTQVMANYTLPRKRSQTLLPSRAAESSSNGRGRVRVVHRRPGQPAARAHGRALRVRRDGDAQVRADAQLQRRAQRRHRADENCPVGKGRTAMAVNASHRRCLEPLSARGSRLAAVCSNIPCDSYQNGRRYAGHKMAELEYGEVVLGQPANRMIRSATVYEQYCGRFQHS